MNDASEELDNCRKMYRRSMEAAFQIKSVGFDKLREDNDQGYNSNSSSGLRTTRLSLLFASLSMAAKNSMSIDEIISSLFDRITQITVIEAAKATPQPLPPQEPAFSTDPIDTSIDAIAVDESYGQNFILWDVVHALADDVLDDVRMRRLRQGFDAIVASLQKREDFEGYQDLVEQNPAETL